ncbi:MAG: Lrp/AsnC ligand binding domain-containing protein [Candidatus Bathyarchaeia archaeon]
MDEEVFKAIKQFPEVKDVVLTYGEYDLIITIEEKSIEDLDRFIFNKLRGINGLAATTTLIQAKPPDFNLED